jgi:hypothetical protein
MNAAAVSRVLSLIPERVARPLSGSLFTSEEAAGAQQAERVAYVAKFLNWLSPLTPITKDDQRFLGLLNAHPRPDHAGDEDAADELDGPLEALDDAPEEVAYEEERPVPPALGAERVLAPTVAAISLASAAVGPLSEP